MFLAFWKLGMELIDAFKGIDMHFIIFYYNVLEFDF
jgi:hypothetical protein